MHDLLIKWKGNSCDTGSQITKPIVVMISYFYRYNRCTWNWAFVLGYDNVRETTQKLIIDSSISLVTRSLTNATWGLTLIKSSGSSVVLPLLFRIPVTKWREYAREAIIKWLLSYSMFMINVYFHAIIVLTGNVNTCVFNKQRKGS